MKYRLGLDLGTNSIGWAVYSLDENNEPEKLEDLGVRIFSDGRNPNTKEPLAVERRTARGQRRIIYRRKLRRRGTFRLLQKQGLLPIKKEEAQSLKIMNPYELRIKALDEKLEPFELGRVLFNLSVRRGFKSNRKDGSQEETKENSKSEKLTQADKCSNLSNAIKGSGCRTLGEFLWKNKESNSGTRFAPNRMDYYPVRQLYIEEFNLIRKKQETFYPDIDWDEIYDKIFFQRPQKVQERGKCQYMPEKERTFKAMPCAQKIRILQDVFNLSFVADGKSKRLLPEWQDEIIKLLDSKEKITFKEIRKKIGLDENITFNLESEARDFLQGNSTAVKLRSKNRFGEIWDSLSLEEQDNIVECLITTQEDSDVQKMLEKYDLAPEQKNFITKLVLPSGTTSFCREFSENVVNKIEENAKIFAVSDERTERCQIHSVIQELGYSYANQFVEKCEELPYYGKILSGSTMSAKSNPKNDEERFGKISNPTVHIALNQTRVVVNSLIKEYGKPAQVVIEVSRELKASREAKEKMQQRIAANQKQNEILNKKIKDANSFIQFPNRTDRLKYKLWEELDPENALNRRCIYCGKQISGADIFNDNTVQIEHILPFGRTLLDSEHNKTVAHTKCNAFKGEKSPYEAFFNNPKDHNWNEILERASHLKDPQKRRLFSENAMETFEKESGFIARQLTDNAYLSKMALKYLKCVVEKDSNVWAVRGGMTKLLRDKWQIDSILKRKIGDKEIAHFELKDEQIGTYKKNRYDHRHHALDASVIALIDRSMVQQISRLNQFGKKNKIEVPQMPVSRLELIEKTKNIVVSFKPDHGAQGKLSKETLLGKIKRAEKISISKINEEDIPFIKNEKVRTEFEKTLAELKDIKKVQKVLKELYPVVWVFKQYYVCKENILGLKEKDFDSIIDKKIQKDLHEFTESHKSEKIEDVMQEFSEQTKIKKIRCINRVQTPIEIKNKDGTMRYLCPEDYFAAIVWQIPPKNKETKPTYKATFIRRDQVDSEGKPKITAQPHPAAKKICVLHKNDYLEFVDNGNWYKCRIAGLNASTGRLDIRPIYAVTDCKDWIISTNEAVLEYYWNPQKGQNFISISVLFGEKLARSITVNPIGRVFRKK
ncbi:type II CRISPR RNA-guided endonuclease Cas9 [uncultured Treponema sp.]|uniref:type II CRISPR RNA-guided endonuclease Cas9 n=1 Tax=uncultured Treponema sp. TaxID=162155 RepID=UPI0025EDD66F|nr:type II CRISPR RNA-guided endonuclease Cas9 [uncultured Treponema sp.]